MQKLSFFKLFLFYFSSITKNKALGVFCTGALSFSHHPPRPLLSSNVVPGVRRLKAHDIHYHLGYFLLFNF